MIRINPVFVLHWKVLTNVIFDSDGEALDDILSSVHDCSFRQIPKECFGDQAVPEHMIGKHYMKYFSCKDGPRPQMVCHVMLQHVSGFVQPQWICFREHVKGAIRLKLTWLVRAASSQYKLKSAVSLGNVNGCSDKKSA